MRNYQRADERKEKKKNWIKRQAGAIIFKIEEKKNKSTARKYQDQEFKGFCYYLGLPFMEWTIAWKKVEGGVGRVRWTVLCFAIQTWVT